MRDSLSLSGMVGPLNFKMNFKNLIRKFCFIIVLAISSTGMTLSSLSAVGNVADAQTPSTSDNAVLSPADLVKQQQAVVNGYKDQLKELLKSYDAGQDDDAALTDIRNKAQDVSGKVINTALLFRSPLNDINLRLDQLGEPQDGVQEAKTVTDERNNLRQLKVKINTLVGQLEDCSIDANRLVERTIAQSRELFARTLTHKVEFSSPLGKQIAQSAKDAAADFFSLMFSWWQFVYQFKLLALCASILIPLFIAGVLVVSTHKLIGRVKHGFIIL